MLIEDVALKAAAQRPSALRRLAAWIVDYFIVAVYMGVLFFVSFLITGGRLRLDVLTTPGTRQLLGAVTLTLPVVVYFAISEASTRQGTIGKLTTRLMVTDLSLRRISFGRSLVRSALKFLPWELAHTFVHRVPALGPIPGGALAALLASIALASIYLVGLFGGQRRPVYDLIAGTRVVSRNIPERDSGTPIEAPVSRDGG